MEKVERSPFHFVKQYIFTTGYQAQYEARQEVNQARNDAITTEMPFYRPVPWSVSFSSAPASFVACFGGGETGVFPTPGNIWKKKHVKTSIRIGKIGYRYGYPRDYLPLQLSVKLVGRHRTLQRGRNNRNNRIVDTLISFIHKLRTHNRMEIVWWTAPGNAGSLSVSSIQVCQNNETQS